MNPYDMKVLNVISKGDNIYELARVSRLTNRKRFLSDVYYLVRKGNVLLMVLVDRKTFNMQTFDITYIARKTKDGNKFAFDGNYYRVHRKVK